jgi:MoxR-like ATPase
MDAKREVLAAFAYEGSLVLESERGIGKLVGSQLI